MKTYSLASDLHEELDKSLLYRSDWENFSTDDCEIFIRTGGSEGAFRALFEKEDGSLDIPGTAPLRFLRLILRVISPLVRVMCRQCFPWLSDASFTARAAFR